MSAMTRKKTVTLLLLGICLSAVAVWWALLEHKLSKSSHRLRGSAETLTIAATGDWLRSEPVSFSRKDPDFARVLEILRNASMGVTNLEVNLLDPKNVPPAEIPGTLRWPYGTTRQAEDLNKLGMNVISLANNRAMDYGSDGMKQTQQLLDDEGLLHVGSGVDLQAARAPVFLGAAPRRIAVVAVTTSASPESRATNPNGEILGRPGVSAIRYSPDVTVDSATFEILKKLPSTAPHQAGGDPNRLLVSGTPIKRGEKTVVRFLPDERDVQEVLEQVKFARSNCDVVVVMLHSHEPSNHSQTAAEFVQTLAHSFIDAGASLVVGSGPHQLRGIEVYNQGAILYSLGNFSADYKSPDSRASDVYDSGLDLYQFSIGAAGNLQEYPPQQFEEPVWWESVVAIAIYGQGKIKSLSLQPIDLGADLPRPQRGLARIAAPDRANAILQRVAALSKKLGTTVRTENGIGTVDVSR
jgi:poly-gamma-glutamate capsule biosynthesis protein CapA/YwtB (metallophosphatase superfamily)